MAVANTVQSFIGQSPFDVTISESPELTDLIAEAKKHKDEDFEQKLNSITSIACGAMKNAYELQANGDKKAGRFVFEEHTLSEALKEQMGCCRYQATLFFLLGEAAGLGKKHYLQCARVGRGILSCFNDVFDDKDQTHHVSIYRKTLSSDRYDYAKGNSTFFDSPVT